MGVISDYQHSERTRRILKELIKIICPSNVVGENLVIPVINEVELSLKALPPLSRTAIIASLIAYDTSSRLYPTHQGKPATKLPKQKAQNYFHQWKNSPFTIQKQMVKAISALITMAYYSLPIIEKRIVYTPTPWIEESKQYRLDRHHSVIQAHENSLLEPDPLPLKPTKTPQTLSGKK